jgi:hypothetical protein
VTSLIPRSKWPFATMLGRVINGVLDKDYLVKHEVPRGKPKFTYAAVPAEYEPLRQRAEELAEHWGKLPDDLYPQLRTIAEGAIESQTRTNRIIAAAAAASYTGS